MENGLRGPGHSLIAGVDEAGRGPLAGPVVAAAVILDEKLEYPGVGDSKKISPAGREKAFRLIQDRARAVGLGLVGQREIDRINILQASLKAMAQAVSRLDPGPDYIIVDGPMTLPLSLPQKAVPHGDSLSLSIGAASIVAKVIRDRMMAAFDRRYPKYGFASHKGYATRAHLEALARHGPCPLHRMSFKRVREDPA
ncbi:MAG: ribonuclease HII [Thermodesulfobacteriota bacterium]|nr:ribonuclease HII [Thermodesulfobacteriota bacterium]